MHRCKRVGFGFFVLTLMIAPAWGEIEEPPKLLGVCTTAQLSEEPFAEWYRGAYEAYTPHQETAARLADIGFDDVEVTVFFGTWCGDSQRELPRLVKLLDSVGFPESSRTLVAVDSTDEMEKRSPDGEEMGLEIYRVPTIIISRNGQEVARMVEHPVLSLERDLLSILSGDVYIPNYASYPHVRSWLEEGLLADPNVSPSGLANQVRDIVVSEGELAAAAGVLISRGQKNEAVKLLQVNCRLYRDSARGYRRLAKALIETDQRDEARKAVERGLRQGPDADELETLLGLLGQLDPE